MEDFLDLDRFPIHDLEAPAGRALVEDCRSELERRGLFNLDGFLRPAGLEQCVREVVPVLAAESYLHRQNHNIYFLPEVEGLAPDHPALRKSETANGKICGDQIPGSLLNRIYEWPPLARFLAAVMGKERLYTMADPLAAMNVMTYRDGQALNWHFDRSEFTTTLLLQNPEDGGVFEYRRDLRSDGDPNYDGVARLVRGEDDAVQQLEVRPGTLNVFR
ncbi:MAG: hypothetical protein MI673_09965, partial [Thiotrichales bacterium]|nr:hypothetical protein [Thiotrichales bacterium]